MTEPAPQIRGLVVSQSAGVERSGAALRQGHCVRVVVASACPADALTLHDRQDVRELALVVMTALSATRGEYPRGAWLVSRDPYLRRDVAVQGSSARLPLALAVIADLYGRTPGCDVYATGDVDPASGIVRPVADTAAKLTAVAARLGARGGPQALVLIPQVLALATEGEAAVRGAEEAIAAVEQAGGEVRRVGHLRSAAEAALGDGFQAMAEDISATRVRLLGLRYSYDYMAIAAAALDLRRRCRGLPAASLAARALRAEALAIGAWAASRLPSGATVDLEGHEQSASDAEPTLRAELHALLCEDKHALWPETSALVENHSAISHIGASLDFSAGERQATAALALPGVIDGPQGEHRKLLGSRAQLRWRWALRLRQAGEDADAKWLADGAVADARDAARLADHPDVDEANDRTRVRVYLATALICRGAAADRAEAEAILLDALGVNADGDVTHAPRQEPGWALRALALLLRHQGPGVLGERWRRWSGTLRWQDDTLGQRFAAAGIVPYREPLAALLAADALASGDDGLAVEMARHAAPTPHLRALAWWWPVFTDPRLADHPSFSVYHRAQAAAYRRDIERPVGPCSGRAVDDLLASLACSDPASARHAWRRLTMWVGDPDPAPEIAP